MCARKTGSIGDLAVIGIDIGEDTFHLVGFDRGGQLVMREQIKRSALNATFERLPRCVVGMRACLGARFVGRTLRGIGFEPRIAPAIYAKPFDKGRKNDCSEAEAIAEAALRPNLRTVSEKGRDQLDPQASYRVRARPVSRRTATINQIRAFPVEQGITVRSGPRAPKISSGRSSNSDGMRSRPGGAASRSASMATGRGWTGGSGTSPTKSRRSAAPKRTAPTL